MLVIDQ